MDLLPLSRNSAFSYRFKPRVLAYTADLRQLDVTVETAENGRVEDERSIVGRKRRVDDKSEQKQDSKRRKATESDAHAVRLIGDYGNPSHAIPISVPSNPSQQQPMIETSSPGSGNSIAAKVGSGRAGKFKPTDTLNQNRYKNGTLRHRSDFGAMGNGRLSHPQKRTSNVSATLSSRPGDGFDPDELTPSRALKRQKLDLGPARAMNGSLVDLTYDENDNTSSRSAETRILSVNGKPVRSSRNLSPRQLSQSNEPFSGNEFHEVDKQTKITRKRQPRRFKDGQPRMSQESSGLMAPLPAQGQKLPQSNLPGTILHGGVSSHQGDNLQVGSSPSANGHTKLKRAGPPINLTKDYPATKFKTKEDVSELDDIGDAMKQREQRELLRQRQKRAIPAPALESPRPRRQIPQDFNSQLQGHVPDQTSMRSEEPQSPRLGGIFVRAGDYAANSRTPARPKSSPEQQQQPLNGLSSRVSPVETDLESEDELTGSNTRGAASQTPQRGSGPPPKQDMRPLLSRSPNQSKRNVRSDITRETQKASASRKTAKHSTNTDGNTTVRIRGFSAAALSSDAKDLWLEYSADDKLIYLRQGNTTAKVPGKDCAISIGNKDVDKINWDSNYQELSVCLKGPKGDVSNGCIVIDFHSAEDVQWFYRILWDICNDRLTSEPVDGSRLRKICETGKETIGQGAKQLRNRLAQIKQAQPEQSQPFQGPQHLQLSAHHGQPTPSQDTRARNLRRQILDDEEIKYEDESVNESRRTSTRQRTREQMADGESGTLSKYFPTQGRMHFPDHPSRFASPPRPKAPKWTEVNKPKPWSSSIIYPSQGAKRSTVDFEDLEKLDEDEFLNDNVVGFAIRYIEENMPAIHKRDVFFFNTFFYTSLTSVNGRKGFNYDAVKRWTKNVDLMSTPYVVVPINANLHWFVAIICNLHNVQRKMPDLDDDDSESEEARKKTDPSDERQIPGELTQDRGVNGEFLSQSTDAMEQLSLSDKNDNVQTPLSSGATKRKSKKKTAPAPRQYNPNHPVVITLDSFGNQHPAETRYLKDYIAAEAKEKRGMQVDRDEIQGMTAKGIPHQTNFSDCGLYVIGYLQEFAKDPRVFVTKVLTRQLDKESDFAAFDPSEKRKQIRDTLLSLNEEREGGTQAQAKAPKSSDKAPASSSSTDIQRPKEASHGSDEREKNSQRSSARNEIPPKQKPETKALTEQDDDELETAVPIALGQRVEHSPRRALYPRKPMQEDDDEMLDTVPSREHDYKEGQVSKGDLHQSMEDALTKHLGGATISARGSRLKGVSKPGSVPRERPFGEEAETTIDASARRARRVLTSVNVPRESQVEIPDSQEKM